MANIKVKGTGTWDTITRKGVTYYRFRKTYDYERKEFVGRTKQIVLEKIKEFENNPTNRSQKNYLKMPFYVYLEECNDYLKDYNRENDWNAYNRRKLYIKHVMESNLGKAQLGCVTDKLIKDFLFELVDKELSRASINKDYFYIKRCLQLAYERGIIKSNPADLVAPIKEREVKKATKVVEPFDLEDMNKILKEARRVNTRECRINGAIGERVYGVNADVLLFQMFSGLRIGEVLGLRYRDLDLDNDYIYVNEAMRDVKDKDGKVTRELGRTKTQKSVRPVPLYKQAKLILKEQQEKHPNATLDDLVFVNEDGGFIDRHKVNRTLKAMAKRGALSNQDVGSHVMRHTFGAYLVTQGVDIYKVSQYLGHSSIRMTEKVYAKLLASKNDMVAINVFDNLFGEE